MRKKRAKIVSFNQTIFEWDFYVLFPIFSCCKHNKEKSKILNFFKNRKNLKNKQICAKNKKNPETSILAYIK